MTPEERKELGELRKEMDALKMQTAETLRLYPDMLRQTQPYTASSPTADGTIQIEVNGVQFNVLVDKI